MNDDVYLEKGGSLDDKREHSEAPEGANERRDGSVDPLKDYERVHHEEKPKSDDDLVACQPRELQDVETKAKSAFCVARDHHPIRVEVVLVGIAQEEVVIFGDALLGVAYN